VYADCTCDKSEREFVSLTRGGGSSAAHMRGGGGVVTLSDKYETERVSFMRDGGSWVGCLRPQTLVA
jgi:hypothetical protein